MLRSGTVLAISFMMSALPTGDGRSWVLAPPRSLRKTAPTSKRTNSIRSEDPIGTNCSRSAVLLAAATALWTAFMSGSPMVATSLLTISSNGLEETTLNLRTWTSMVGISLPQLLCLGNRGPQNLRSLLSARLGLCIPFVNVRGGGTVDQETEQFRPAVVTSRVHH